MGWPGCTDASGSTRATPICGQEGAPLMSEHDQIDTSDRWSRRRFLSTVGAGAVAVGTSGAIRVPAGRAAAAARVKHAPHAVPGVTTHFGRIFGRMEPFADPGK